jgi:hypothetical protein
VVAGIAALLRQLHPAVSGQDIRRALMATASRPRRPNDTAGYGLVNGGDAHRLLLRNPGHITVGSSAQPLLGGLLWRSGDRRIRLSWGPGLDPASARLFDMEGRASAVRAGTDFSGFWAEPLRRAPGVYAWRIPVRPDTGR